MTSKLVLPILTEAQQRHYDAFGEYVDAQQLQADAENEGLDISHPEEFKQIEKDCDAAQLELIRAEKANNNMNTNELVEYATTPVRS